MGCRRSRRAEGRAQAQPPHYTPTYARSRSMTACFSSSLLHLPWAHLHGFIAALEFTRMGSSDKSVGLIVTSKFPVRPTSRLSETMTDPFSSSTASMRSLSARASAPNPQSPQYWMVTVQVLLPEAATFLSAAGARCRAPGRSAGGDWHSLAATVLCPRLAHPAPLSERPALGMWLTRRRSLRIASRTAVHQ
eukprot:TRINITY_DN597_c0_g1_i6.p1 TRINITY_DN597_c0_g1~~TRINITY_DN597_c0_g1_i6.p1  ORF type:complete len:192 (-),score=3.52 TRINITY_DN597_c0_g1_i6:18-593(-)